MRDLEYVLKLVKIQKGISFDVLSETQYLSHAHIEARGAINAYSTVEQYLNSLLLKKEEKSKWKLVL